MFTYKNQTRAATSCTETLAELPSRKVSHTPSQDNETAGRPKLALSHRQCLYLLRRRNAQYLYIHTYIFT